MASLDPKQNMMVNQDIAALFSCLFSVIGTLIYFCRMLINYKVSKTQGLFCLAGFSFAFLKLSHSTIRIIYCVPACLHPRLICLLPFARRHITADPCSDAALSLIDTVAAAEPSPPELNRRSLFTSVYPSGSAFISSAATHPFDTQNSDQKTRALPCGPSATVSAEC